MNPSDPSERLERMKQVLADSYPRVAEGQRKEPLPESVRAALRGPARREATGVSYFERLLALFRGPQLAAIAVTAVLVIAAVLHFGPSQTGRKNDTDTMRSGGGTVSLPSVVVLHGLSEAQLAALKSSGYFRAEQLLVVPAGQELAAFLGANRRPNLVLVDGAKGTISAPFATAAGPAAVTFASGETDLAPQVLDMLAKIPEPEPEPKAER